MVVDIIIIIIIIIVGSAGVVGGIPYLGCGVSMQQRPTSIRINSMIPMMTLWNITGWLMLKCFVTQSTIIQVTTTIRMLIAVGIGMIRVSGIQAFVRHERGMWCPTMITFGYGGE